VRVKIAIPEAHVSKPVLDAGLEAVTRLNEQMLANGEIPPFDEAVKMGIRWAPEPPGAEHFDHGAKVLQRKKGDCDDMAPYKAATLRHTGEDPDACAEVYRSGPTRWHAIVRRGDGSIDDPSKAAGMRRGVAAMTQQEMQGVFGAEYAAVLGVVGAAHPLMFRPQACVGDDGEVGAYIARPQVALRPFGQSLQARVDLPWRYLDNWNAGKPSPTDLALSSLHTSPVASAALTGAIQGVLDLAEANDVGDPDHIDRLCAIADGCEGMSFDEVAAIYGYDNALNAAEVIGSLFGRIAKIAKGAVKIAVPSVANLIPGGSAALAAAKKAGRLVRGSPRAAPARAAAPSAPAPVRRPVAVPAPARAPAARPAPVARRAPAPAPRAPAANPDAHFAAIDEPASKGGVVIHIHN
jgi:hypothetical protein